MRVVGISGSPRNGNTEFLVSTVLDQAQKNGSSTKLILLREKKISMCTGCLKCQETGHCAIRDDMDEIVRELQLSDIYVIGSPSYFNLPSALLKNFMERTNPLYKRLAGKKAVLLIAGASAKHSDQVGNALKVFCDLHQLHVIKTYLAVAKEKGEAAKNEKIIEELREIGKGLKG